MPNTTQTLNQPLPAWCIYPQPFLAT